jgi:hypothetical protein
VSSPSIPAAILAGSALIALGLFFGLRARPVPLTASPPSVATLTGAGTGVASAVVSPPVAPSPQTPRAELVAAVKEQIEAQHAHLVDACWAPSFARNPKPAQVTLSILLEYAEDGRLAVHSLHQDRTFGRSDVEPCVGRELVMPTLSAPGRRLRVNVPIVLP